MRTVFNNNPCPVGFSRWLKGALGLGALVTAGAAASGCSTASGGDTAPGVFVAYPADFANFRTWSSTPGVAPSAPQPLNSMDGGIHSGPLTTYINHLPPKGSTSFPVGTIIVKEPDDPPLTDRQIFAMVKRGGGYNVDGATDWEWYELRNVDAQNVTILWSGPGPSGSEAYATTPQLCNDCHEMNAKNDFVWTQGLQLPSL